MTALAFPGVSDGFAQNVIGTFTSTTAGYLRITIDAPLAAGYLLGRVNAAEDDDVFADADVANRDDGGVYVVLPITGADDWKVYAYIDGDYDAGLDGAGTFTAIEGDCLVHEGPLDNPGDAVTLDGPYVPDGLVVIMNDEPLIEDSGVGGGWDEDDPEAGTLDIIESQGGGDLFDFYYLDPDCPVPDPAPGLWAEFDGEWEQLPVMDWHVQRGVSGDLAGGTSPGSATFTIQNPADRYNPYNAASPLAGFLKDGVRVWAGINDDGTIPAFGGKTVRGVFAGFANDWEPMPEAGADVSPTVVLTCADPLEWMGRQPVRLADSTERSQADVRAEVLSAIGWAYGTDLPAEPTTLPLSGFDGLAGNVLDSLNRANGTRHYIKPADNLTDWATYTAVRRTSLLDANTLASLDAGADHVTGTSGWRLSADGVVNQQRASVEPIDFPGRIRVWEPDLLPFTVDGEMVVWVEFGDYVGDPLIDIDYTGSALTTDIEPFGRTAKVTLTSAGTSVVTDLDITGYLAQRGSTVSVVVDDTASQAGTRGVRAGPDLSGDLLGTITSGHGIASHIVYRFAQPLGRPTVTVVNWLPDQFERDLLQLVDVTVAELAISAGVYEIIGLTHDAEVAAAADDGTPTAVSHTVTYVLQESREQTDPGWFILDDSLLDGDDILAC